MNELSTITKQTMSSLEIAELVESRHDKVKQSIDRLAERGVIEFPPLGEIKTATKPVTVYHICKRDSYIIVAQLSPEFTAKLIDRWRELEAEKPKELTIDLMIEAYQAQKLLIESKNQLLIATNQAQIAAGEILVREFVKANDLIELGEKGFFSWMREQNIVSESNEPYQHYVKRGYFTYKPTEERRGGKFRYTLRITPRGKIWLAAKYLAYLDGEL